MIDKLNHYSLTNPSSVYDEEALTALELAARTAAKVNEAIESVNENTENVEKIPSIVTKEVKNVTSNMLENGVFDTVITEYVGDLNARIDNLENNIVEGSTTMDAEVIDARYGGDGNTYVNLGSATREQYKDLRQSNDEKLSSEAVKLGYKHNLNHRSLWVQGWLNSETGEHGTTGTDYNNFICTPNFIPIAVNRMISNELRVQILIFTHAGSYVGTVATRRADYIFDHSTYRYKLQATGYDSNILNYNKTKALVSVEDFSKIILMSGDADYNETNHISVKAEKYGYKRDINTRAYWSQGYIFSVNGENGTDPAGYDYWIYSRVENDIPKNVERVVVGSGYKGRLFVRDNSTHELIRVQNFTGSIAVNDENGVYYRLDVCPVSAELGTRYPVDNVWSNVLFLADKVNTSTSGSRFITDVDFTPYTHDEYYLCETYHPYAMATQTSEIISAFDNLVNEFNPYASSFTIGTACDGRNIKAYRFKSADVNGSVNFIKPKIVIVGGQHGFEKTNVFGLESMFRTLCGAYVDIFSMGRDIARYLAENVEFIVVPVANPTGFDTHSYKNANGVNLNRNYDYKWVKVADKTSDYYGGEAPFDQPETQAIRNLIESEDNIFLVIDSHTKGSSHVTNWHDVNWIIGSGETDKEYVRLAKAIRNHITEQTHYFWSEEAIVEAINGVGYFEGFDGTVNTIPSLDNWCTYVKDVRGITVEGCNGLPHLGAMGQYGEEVQCFNTRMMMNLLGHICAEYGRGSM